MRFVTLPRPLLIVIILAATLLPGSVGQAAPARDTNIQSSVGLRITLEENPLCAGRDYEVTVIPVEKSVILAPDREVELSSRALLGLAVEGTSGDRNIATIQPAKAFSGWLTDDPVVGAAVFTLHANKAGATNIWFEAQINHQYFGPVIPITVINCKYKVTMTFRAAGGTEGYVSRGSGKVEGEIAGNSSGNLKGTANQGYWDMHAFSACCSHTISSNSPNATLSGTLSADGTTLSLHADFSAISATDTSVSHPAPIVGSITGTSTANMQIPPLDVNLSASGDSKLQEVSIPVGDISLQAAVVISATPITGQ